MRVGWDLDGVVYPFVASFRAVVERRTRVRHALPEPSKWEFWEDWGMEPEEWREHFDAGVEDGSLFTWGAPLDHGTINKMYDLHSIHIVTSRPVEARPATLAWLRQHGIRYDSLTFTDDKTSVPTDVFVDDHPSTVEKLVANGTWAVLYDQPWNRGPESKGLHRVYSIREYRDFVKAVGG